MTSQNLKHAIRIFSNRRDAEQAIVELKNRGFPMHKISVITKTSDNDDGLDNQGVQQPSMTRAEGAKAGAIIGSTGVGLITLIVGLSTVLVPGVGAALAVESMITVILGSGAAAVAGGLYGALQGWFVPEEQARFYSERFNQGDYLVIVEATKDEIQTAESVLSQWGMQTWRVYNAP